MIETESVMEEHATTPPETGRGDMSLHIERLVLDGLPLAAGAAAHLQNTVQTELARLLAQDGLAGASQGALRSVTAPGFQIVSHSAPAELGKKIAHSVYESLLRNT